MMAGCSSYIKLALDPETRGGLIDKIVNSMQTHPLFDQCEAIAVRGTSGLLVGPEVAQRLGKPLAVVRKAGETHHTFRNVECCVPHDRYFIVDDHISTGSTIKTIVEDMARSIQATKPLAVFLYGVDWDDSYRESDEKIIGGIPVVYVRGCHKHPTNSFDPTACLGGDLP